MNNFTNIRIKQNKTNMQNVSKIKNVYNWKYKKNLPPYTSDVFYKKKLHFKS